MPQCLLGLNKKSQAGRHPRKTTRDPETNCQFAPKNGCLEYFLVFFWDTPYFQCRTVSFRERNSLNTMSWKFGWLEDDFPKPPKKW